jgi:hypothetical protein
MTDGDIAFARHYTGVKAAWGASAAIRMNRYNTRAFLEAAQNYSNFLTKQFLPPEDGQFRPKHVIV